MRFACIEQSKTFHFWAGDSRLWFHFRFWPRKCSFRPMKGAELRKAKRRNWLCKIQSFSEWLIFPLIRFKRRNLFNCSIVDWISLKRWGVIQFLVFTYYYNSSGLLVVGPCGMVVKMQNQFVVPYQVFQPLEEGETKMPPLQIWHFAFFGNTAANFLPPFNPNWLQLYFVLTWCIEIDEKYDVMALITLLENLKLCPKIQFSEKITKLWIWNFVPKINQSINLLISNRFWIFTPKMVKIQQFSVIVDSVLTQNHDFGAKIQII